MLIVGDTWCAITDPLRYHSRISELKAWFLIAATWFLSILFGIASAFRYELPMSSSYGNSVGAASHSSNINTNNQITAIMYNSSNKLASSSLPPTIDHEFIVNNAMSSNELYNLLFACVYFIVIIMLPILLVCGMYWKIFSEAKQNGLRMRQNGSSPLLQSALNLAAASAAAANCSAQSQSTTSTMPHGGLTMKIDKHLTNNNNNNNNNHMGKESYRPLLVTPTNQRRYLEIPKEQSKDKNDNHLVLNASQQTCDSDDQSYLHPHEQQHQQQQNMRRNVSARHLMMLEQADLKPSPTTVRHTHSSPNLHKSFEQLSHIVSTSPMNSVSCNPQPNNYPNNHQHHHHQHQHHHHHHHHHHVPPKALSYMTSIRHRLSNASSIFKYREESRAARISILVVIMFLISYFPYGLLVLLHGRLSFITNSAALAVTFLMVANVSSPFLFAYRNKRVRRGVCRLFGIDPKTNQRLQKHRLLLGRNRSGTTIKIHRNSSKASAYSVNSTKYLTPQSAALLPQSTEKLSSCLTNNDRYGSRNALNGMSGSIMTGGGGSGGGGKTLISANRNCDKKIKFSLFKRMCDTSKKLGCAMDSSCTSNSSCQEVADV